MLMILYSEFHTQSRNWEHIPHNKWNDTKLKSSQFKKITLKYFEGLYLNTTADFSSIIIFIMCFYGIFLVLNVSLTPEALWKTSKQGRILTDRPHM